MGRRRHGGETWQLDRTTVELKWSSVTWQIDDSMQRLAFPCIGNQPRANLQRPIPPGLITISTAESRIDLQYPSKSIGDNRMQGQRGALSQSRGTDIITACRTVKWSACV